MEVQSAHQEEQARLAVTLAAIESQLERLRAVPRYRGQDYTEQALEAVREQNRTTLATAEKEPYFGRLDFQEHGHSDPVQLYIGKTGLQEDRSSQLLVIDWRAPAASMFYSFTGGEGPAYYESPDGIVEGNVHLKRNLVIRNKELQRLVDTYTRGEGQSAVADEFLLYRLGENKDNRLRDIVSTIQAEQDRIIRSPRHTALVIQGVAGSGKTTVALHRLAYLLYQYRDSMRAERMIIFAPNSMFLHYISGVLPELGVGDIKQTTFADWALELLQEKLKLADAAPELKYWFAAGVEKPVMDDRVPGRWKGSVAFMRLIDEQLDRFEQSFLPQTPFEAWEGTVLPAEQIYTWFYVENRHETLMRRRDRLEARMKRWLEMQLNDRVPPSRRKEAKKKATQRLNSWLKGLPDYKPFEFYRRLFDNDGKVAPARGGGMASVQIPSAVAEASVADFKRKQVRQEDLAPLVHIFDRFYGIGSEFRFDHVVVDEAQDFSPFQIALLKHHVRGNSFTILGDLSQGIHAYRGIRSWDEFIELFDEERAEGLKVGDGGNIGERGPALNRSRDAASPVAGAAIYFELARSYRSTMEIIQFANEVLKRSGERLTLAEPVFRSGEPVAVMQVEKRQREAAIVDEVRKLLSSGVSTIAVVGRTDKVCMELQAALGRNSLESTLIEAGQREYAGGISVVPVYLTKGLEFDAVIIADADETGYGSNAHDAKLLYVGCTRALHRLTLMYTGKPSPLLPKADAGE